MIETKTVATPSAAAAAMHKAAVLPRTLTGGTAAMRAAGKTYLPKEEGESESAYSARLCRSTLFNAFDKTVNDMAGKVFSKPIVLKDNVPPALVNYAEDIDLAGTHLNIFAHLTLKDAMQTGIGYFLTDAPPPPNADRQLTKADTNAAGIRPYLTYIKVEQMLGWKSERIAGAETLTQVRFMERVTEHDGAFHEKEVNQIRILTPSSWETQRSADGKEWKTHKSGDNLIGKITLTPFYVNRTGFMTGTTPLQALAEINVAHWQQDSDLTLGTRYANVPILFAAGFGELEAIVISPTMAVRSSNADAKLTRVEHSGRALGFAAERLKNLELQMQALGLQLLIDKPGQTATGEVRDDVKENSQLAAIADSLKDALEVSLGFMAEYERLGADAGGEIEVNKDFGISSMDVPQVVACFSAGLIDAQTAVDELKRRAFLSDSVDAAVVMERLANQMQLEATTAMDLQEAKPAPFQEV